jgi:hypothetical protein
MPCRSASLSATSASGFKGSAGATLGSGALGLISLTFGPRLPSSSLLRTEPDGSPAAARQLGPTTGFGGSCVWGAAALAAAPLSGTEDAAAGGAGGDDAAAFGAIVGCGAVIVESGVGEACGAKVAAGAAVGLVAGGAIAPRSLTSRGGVSRLGAPVAISHTDILPNVKPNVMPANSSAAAASVRSRRISGSLCI